MFYDIMIDVKGIAAINAITLAFPQLNTRRVTPSFLAAKLSLSEWRYEAIGRIMAADMAILGDILANIGENFDTIRIGKAQ